MVWYLPWSESIKKRACRYLLQRYLGNFLNEKLTLEQLSVDLYNGTGTVSDVRLDCEALNELGDSQNWPLEIIDGQVKEITVTIPWSTILKEDSIVEINGLSLTVQPKVRAETVSSMLESMWSSMSSSMQLATEFLQEDAGPQESNPVEGIEMFAHAIDSILSRVKVKFINTKIRLEHVSKNSDKGIALQILIRQIDYFDETETETLPETTKDEKTKTYTNATYLTKKIKVNGVTFYIDEFPSKLRTMAHSLIMEKSTSTPLEKNEETCQESADLNFQSTMSDVFYEARSIISTVDSEIMQDIAEEKQSNTPRESTPHETLAQTDPVLFAKLTDQQELSLRLKHLEEVEGPKIAVQISLGSLLLFITPKQLNTLLELVDAINQPHLEDTSNIPIRSCLNMQCKQMKQKDFQFIEAQLIGNLDRQHLKPQNAFGWSGPSFDDSDDESDKFLPMTSNDEMPKSLTSSISSMNTSMTSSVNIPSLHPKITRNKKVPNVDGDPTAEVSHISFKMASFSCVLLHKNVIVPMPIGTPYISSASTLKLQEMSTEFFNRLETFGNVDKNSNIKMVNEALDKATERDHLRILLTEISLDGSEKVTSHGSKTMFEAYTKRMLVSECLYFQREDPQDQTPQKFDLIWFEHKENESSVAAAKADMTISFKQTSKYMRISGEKQLVYPTTDVLINCSPCYIDVDLTLMERMSAVFFAPSTTATPTTPTMPTSLPQKNQMNISVQSPNLNVRLRFPVVDLRPGASREVRRVRPDWLAFRFHNATLSTQRRPPASYSVKATSLDLYYHENEKLPPTHIAQTCMDVTALEQNILSGNTTPLLPIITLTLKPREPNENLFESLQDETEFEPSADNPMTTSVYMMENLRSGRPSPFSGKKVAHQSIIKNEKDKKDQEDELIVPGNEEEMTEFTNDSVEHSAVHLDFNLPILSLQIESKHLYEIIYNRINSDLLLWEPQPVDQFDITPHMNVPIHPAFGVCKGMEYDSDTESTASDEEKFYIPTHDDKLRKGHRKYSDKDSEVHNFCLTLKVGKGLMTIFAPVRDSNKLVVPGQMGELVLDVNKLSLCQLSGLNGRPKTARMCLRAGKTTLYNEPILTIPSEKPKLRLYGTPLPSYLKKTIYPSGKGVTIKEQLEVKDMFTMALRTDPKNDLPNIKCICIALSIEQATLRHRGDKGAAWLAQLVDVLDVLDYPVPGYTPSAVLSELHAHVWDCAVDYRPLYLPIRTVLTLGNFSYSSNIIPETNATVLRFLAQECTLFLSHFTGAKSNVRVPQDDDKLPNVHKDYVCVVDVGLFELSLRTEDKKNAPNNHPQVELTASNNMVNLYTCCDSASALCRLVTYIASDGDSQPPAERSRHTSICSDHTGEPLVGLDNRPVEEVSPSDLKHVNDLMEEAMKESPNSTMEEDELNSSTEKEDVKEFLFPDEANVKQDNLNTETGAQSFQYDDYPPKEGEAKPTNIQVARDLGNTSSTPKSTPQKSKRKKKKSSGEGHNTDDEYCIVEEQVYREDDEMDEPVVTWLGEPRFMIDDHFITTGAKTDVLQAPKSFPLPVLRYTLCELSLTWNIFGGNDFRPIGDTMPTRKTIGIDDTRKQSSPKISKRSKEYEPYETSRAVAAAYRQGGVSYSAGADRVRPPPPAAAPAPARRDLRSRGGALRDHGTCVKLCLGKVKLQHEVYPQGSTYASRQTLAITKIEVLDRLLCSDINKLLSQHYPPNEPQRKNTHMLVIKAVHLRVPSQECCLKVSLMPLWFNLDQDTIGFLANFFTKLGSDETNNEDTSLGGLSTESTGSRQTTPTHRPPVMSLGSAPRAPPSTPTSLGDADSLSLNESVIRDDEPLMENYEAERLVSENLIQLEEDFQRLGINPEKPTTKVPESEPVDDSPIYFRRVVFTPEVPIRLDYVRKCFDMSVGPLAGLIMGLGHLNYSELTLKRLDHRSGLLGFQKLVQWALNEWLMDIKKNQLPGLLSGIGPMHSLLQIVTGICDLVWLPVEQWRRDGRLVHGLRRGAASFTARTAVAALDITARLLHLIQATAETACDMLTPSASLALRERRPRRRRDSRPPADIREGVNSAYNTVREGIAETAATMVVAARSGSGAGVLRHLPGAAVTPLALAAAGAADVLGGVRAHLAPHLRRDHADKWRVPDADASD